QNQHCPHAMWTEVTTRSPVETRPTASPTRSTMPTPSCPIVVPGSIGALPWKKCRSDPQIAARRTRTIASVGSTISGSSRSTTSTTPSERKTAARISGLVGELGRDQPGQSHELVRRVDVPHDRRQITADAKLPLHHRFDRVELA